MLQQFSKTRLTDKTSDKIEAEIERFEPFPLFFLNFYGSTHIDLLFETLDYAIYTYDI